MRNDYANREMRVNDTVPGRSVPYDIKAAKPKPKPKPKPTKKGGRGR